MLQTRVVCMSPSEWGEVAAGYRDLVYTQTPSFVIEAARENRAVAEFVALQAGEKTIGLCAVRVRRLPALPLGVAYVLHGPLTVRDEPFSARRYALCVEALARRYVRERKLLLRIVPPFEASRHAVETTEALVSAGFRKLNRRVNRTIVLAVDRDLDEIRKGLEGRWRNKLKQAERTPFEIVETSDPDAFTVMEPMLEDLEAKKNFTTRHGVAFFQRAQRLAAPFERLTLHLGRFQGRVVSAHLVSFAGDTAVSLLAATNEEGRDLKISHRMQWRVIEDAVKLRKRWYDLGGIDPDGNPGVHTFKRGVNGADIAELGLFERAPIAFVSRAVEFLEDAYRWYAKRR